ncbi:hypothetical protein [Polyangium fumosum]|uniref:hypothetical protein n=1 Tax=Polyangium fumosum TaxID=889272 RepID=UPI0014795AFF|nr:hypothetical protein [Polyangium fumosum]
MQLGTATSVEARINQLNLDDIMFLTFLWAGTNDALSDLESLINDFKTCYVVALQITRR